MTSYDELQLRRVSSAFPPLWTLVVLVARVAVTLAAAPAQPRVAACARSVRAALPAPRIAARSYAPPRAACFAHARACFAGAPSPSRCVARCVGTRASVQ